MSPSSKRTSPSTLDDHSSPKAETSRSAKQAKLETSLDVHEARITQEDGDTRPNAETDNVNRRASLAASGGDADVAAVLHFMKAKIIDLEAKLLQMQGQAAVSGEAAPASFLNGDGSQFDNAMAEEFRQSVLEEPAAKRKPAIPMLNRVLWVPFKNAYPDEDPYAIDVLMGPPKFYWQRRAEEREMKDRIEAAKVYDAVIKHKAVVKEKEKEVAKAKLKAANGNEAEPTRKEMPERIRINSQPVLAILADISSEKWTSGPKVMLRPYKFLVAYEAEIRERFEFLKKLWAQRPKPEDVTISASAMTMYEPETLDDELGLFEGSLYQGRQSDTSSLLNHERQARRVDLTTTYDALQDLECLIEFMDDDLFPVVRRYVSPSTYPKIHFRDLWYLYQPGEWVTLDERRGRRFSPDAGPEDEKPPSQPGNLGERVTGFWRVRKTVGGRPKLSPPNKDERNRSPSNELTPLTVRCYRIDYNGDGFGPIWVDFDFQPWEGEKLIEQLEIVPVRLLKKAREKRGLYVKRGKQFMELTVPQHRIHAGPLLDFHPSGRLFEHVSPGQRDVYGSVIVDFKETARTNPKMVMKLGWPNIELWDLELTLTEDYPLYVWEDRKGGRWKETADEIYDDLHIDEHLKYKHVRRDRFLSRYENLRQGENIDGSEFGDDEYCLLPNRVCAYILQRRRFAILKLNCLRPQGPDSHNWDDLFLTRDNKETVKAQTMSHFRNKRLRAANPQIQFDLNQEKGLGLIILLHGVPGVGKTSTAECVAQLLGKPLFPITCGDLGTSADQVETQLYEIFGKAEKWDCVLLLDEADVFLASRGKNDLKRNAVVSVFLRILELYTGILFLTTNRIGVLDEAFMSRIHTQLYYPPLEYDQSMKIWATNLKKLQMRKGATMKIDVDEIMNFAKDHFYQNEKKATRWNGRQIRNACQAAAALTEHEAFDGCMHDGIHTPEPSDIQPVARLEVRHFEKVDNAMREFHDYMANVCGEDFSGVARNRGERDDGYVYEQPRRYPEQRFGGHDPVPMPNSPRADAYEPDNGLGLSMYGGGGGGYGGPPRGGGAVFSPHDRDRRSRPRWGSGGGPGGFSREQERDRDRDRSYFP